MWKIEDTPDATLPSPRLCALMAYEHLKYGGNADTAMAWAQLGTLLLELPESRDDADTAIEVAKAAHALSIADTEQNRMTLQKHLAEWIDGR